MSEAVGRHMNSLFRNLFEHKVSLKVLRNVNSIKLKHYNVDYYIEALILDIEKHHIRISLSSEITRDIFCIDDPVVINFINSNQVYWASGQITDINHNIPLEVCLLLNEVVTRNNIRNQSRYFVSLPGVIKEEVDEEEKNIVVKDLSFSGVKIICEKELKLKSIVYVTINISKSNKFSFKGKVIRMSGSSKIGFEYGLEIHDILRENSIILCDYISKLENNL